MRKPGQRSQAAYALSPALWRLRKIPLWSCRAVSPHGLNRTGNYNKYEAEQKELTKFVSETETEIQTAKQDVVDLKAFLENIRECTDIQKLTPTLVNTLIKKIEIFNSVKGEDGKKHVPITIHFRSVDIVTVPDEEEIIAAMEEIRNNPTKVA